MEENNSFKPYVSADKVLPEFTPSSFFIGVLLAFAMSFDDVVISIFVTGPKVNTLPVKIYTKLKTGVTPEINALATVMLFVILLCLAGAYVLGRKSQSAVEKAAGGNEERTIPQMQLRISNNIKMYSR